APHEVSLRQGAVESDPDQDGRSDGVDGVGTHRSIGSNAPRSRPPTKSTRREPATDAEIAASISNTAAPAQVAGYWRNAPPRTNPVVPIARKAANPATSRRLNAAAPKRASG